MKKLIILTIFTVFTFYWTQSFADSNPYSAANNPYSAQNNPYSTNNNQYSSENNRYNTNSTRIIRNSYGEAIGYAAPRSDGGTNYYSYDEGYEGYQSP
jgi:hypothetical protein